MNSLEIDKALRGNKTTSNHYIGCYPSDKIPAANPPFPKCMVVNTDTAREIGEHWCALFIPHRGHVDYYDSFGEWPPPSTGIIKFLEQFDHIEYNRVALQSERSNSCGRHVIYFLYMRSKGHSFSQIIQQLIHAKRGADQVVNSFYNYLTQKYK